MPSEPPLLIGFSLIQVQIHVRPAVRPVWYQILARFAEVWLLVCGRGLVAGTSEGPSLEPTVLHLSNLILAVPLSFRAESPSHEHAPAKPNLRPSSLKFEPAIDP
jgi:hypothetical protein